MGCQGYQRNFAAYLDGELDRSQREAIDRHVRVCVACRRDLATLRQTLDLLHSPLVPVADAPSHVRELLSRKIIAVRQPISWRDRLFFWRTEGRPRQAVAWGYGIAATAILFLAASGSLDWLAAPGLRMQVVPGRERPAVTTPAPRAANPTPVARPRTAPIRWWLEGQAVVGRTTVVLLFVDLGRDVTDGEVRVFPAAGVRMSEQAILQDDASYLVYRGPLLHGSQQRQWIQITLRPDQEGTHAMRVVVREAGRPVAEERISLTAVAPLE